MSYFVVRKRDPRTDEPPCDGTQIVYGFKEGVVLAGDAHWAWQELSEADEPDVEVNPDIVWWFNAERDLEDVPPQLLADLREAANACAVIAVLRQDKYWNGVAARVRALLPEEGET